MRRKKFLVVNLSRTGRTKGWLRLRRSWDRGLRGGRRRWRTWKGLEVTARKSEASERLHIDARIIVEFTSSKERL